MKEATEQPKVAFSASAQYKCNMQAKGDGGGDDDDEEKEPTGSGVVPVSLGHPKKKKKRRAPKKKRKKVVIPSRSELEGDGAPFVEDTKLGEDTKYQPGNLRKIQEAYVVDFLSNERKAGRRPSRSEAIASWHGSLKRAQILSTLSVADLKRRKFIPKGSTTNPFRERIGQMAS